MPTCVYCLNSAPDLKFSREHVMCQAFGKFKNNLVLRTEVCADCNDVMGRTIETPGARGSIEGVHRFHTKTLMGVESFVKMPKSRVTFEMDEPGWDGLAVYAMPTDDGTGVQAMFQPQIVVTYENGSRRSFRLNELTDAKAFQGAKAYRAYADSKDELKAIAAALEPLGVHPVWKEVIEAPAADDGTVKLSAHAIYDDISRRLAAKIAFNYLASIRGGPFMLKNEFDPIRRFIRYGEGRGADFVAPDETPLLHEEKTSGGWSATDDHMVAVDRSKGGGMLGHVTLFNMIHNLVVLCKSDPDIIDSGQIPSGRRFSWRTGEISPLLGWAEHNLVQPFDVLARRRR